ncbi:MAG: 2-aminoethylphosphonate--pyruvate transaminase [Polyangiaceae bacterium]
MSESADKLLFTPGPLTTSATVKQAMMHDLGSRDAAFIAAVRRIRSGLLAVGRCEEPSYTAIPVQGSGTFGVEATLGTAIPRDGKLLVLVNGAYGTRMVQMAKILGIAVDSMEVDESHRIDPVVVDARLAADRSITHVAVVHCETSTGILNPVHAIGEVVNLHGRQYIVDAMSSFGGVPLSIPEAHIHYLVSSANKCIEGVPGFSFVIAHRETLEATAGNARSLTLDLLAQVKALDASGQFRFTPPTHAMLAFDQALKELEGEGGVAGRAARYASNHRVLLDGMFSLGFRPYLPPEYQHHIITSFYMPRHPSFHFEDFYSRLSDRGFVIYPGKVSKADCFRIGTIGRLFPVDIERLLAAIREVLAGMGVPVPLMG